MSTEATTPPATRRQERGLRRIEEILDAADALFTEVGYEAASTNQIAARAGVSPGSLYQFFANKQAIAEALADRYLRLLGETRRGLFDPELVMLPVPELTDRVVDPLIAFNLAHPGVKTMLAESSPELTAAAQHLHQAMCGRVETLIEGLAPDLAVRDRRLAAEVTIQIFGSLLPSILSAGKRERPRIVRELKAALAGYLGSLDARR
jgi:AcrR family transcriptional regulator